MWATTSNGLERVVKGSHIAIAAEWIDARLGQGEAARISAGFGGDWRVVLAVARYDVDVLLRVLHAASERTGVRVEDITTEVAKLNAMRDLRGLYRTFLRVAQPVRVLAQTPRLWRTYVSFANARAVFNEPGHYVGEGYDLEARDLPWANGCWRGFIPAAISVAGGRNVQGRILSHDRQPDGLYTVRFECTYL